MEDYVEENRNTQTNPKNNDEIIIEDEGGPESQTETAEMQEKSISNSVHKLNEARFSNIFIEKRVSSCQQSLEKSRLFSYPLLMSEGENSQNVKRIFLRKVVI